MRGAARHDAAERQCAGLRAHDVEAGRLGDQRGVERAVALERGERAQPAVLLRADALHHHRRAAADGRGRVQRRDDRGLHVNGAAPIQRAILDGSRPRAVPPRHGAGPDDVDVAVEAEP